MMVELVVAEVVMEVAVVNIMVEVVVVLAAGHGAMV
jgi:hypothetical protein